MKLSLAKYHGWGNDFLVADGAELPATVDRPGLARRLCDRRRGIGADGLLLSTPSVGYTAAMTLYNADGSHAMMSGNGIRCFAYELARRAQSFAEQTILTDSGARSVTLAATERTDTIEASVGMGPVLPISAPNGWDSIGAHPDRPVAHLSLGNPHTVVGVDDVTVVDLVHLGRTVPETNLEIIEPGPEPHAVTMRVHERGAGVTEACGTGACASAWAAVSWGLVPASADEVVVHMDGGSAKVRLHHPAPGEVTLTGPAVFVGIVEVELDHDDPDRLMASVDA
jgi:diaminopimelate epimerase